MDDGSLAVVATASSKSLLARNASEVHLVELARREQCMKGGTQVSL